MSSPPAYPTRLPSFPMTRWQGMTIATGLAPLACPEPGGFTGTVNRTASPAQYRCNSDASRSKVGCMRG